MDCVNQGWWVLTRSQGTTDVGEHTHGNWGMNRIGLISVICRLVIAVQPPNPFYLNFHTRFQAKTVGLSITELFNQMQFYTRMDIWVT